MNLKLTWNNFVYYSAFGLVVPIFYIFKQRKIMLETFDVFKQLQSKLVKLINFEVKKIKESLKNKSIKIPQEIENLIDTITKTPINIQTINLINEETKVAVRLIRLKNKQFHKSLLYDELFDLWTEIDSLIIAYYAIYNSLSYKMRKWPYLTLAERYQLKSFRIKVNEY